MVLTRTKKKRSSPRYPLAAAMEHTGAKRSTIENFVRSGIVTPAHHPTGIGKQRGYERPNLQVIVLADGLTTLGIEGRRLEEVVEEIVSLPEWRELCEMPQLYCPRPWLRLAMDAIDVDPSASLMVSFHTAETVGEMLWWRAHILNIGALLTRLDDSLFGAPNPFKEQPDS